MQDDFIRFVPRVPILTDFAASGGLPVVVNVLTGIAYYVDLSDVIQVLGGASASPIDIIIVQAFGC